MTRPTLALSMIVRDAEDTLARCLKSVEGVVDEIVIADTGSGDRTPDIARQHGVRVMVIPWENDFARARNQALAEVSSDWVLSLDADEVLDPGARGALPALLGRASTAGYQVPIRNYVLSLNDRLWDRPARPNDSSLPAARHYPAYTEHENVRLFRHLPEIFFVGRVHESVGSRILETRRKLGHATFLIHHFGMTTEPRARARKNELYRELGRQKVREMPSNAQAHLELGLVEFDNFGNYAEALSLFQRACQLNPRLLVAWFFAGLAHSRLEHFKEAIACFQRAEADRSKAAIVAEAQGDAFYNLRDFGRARNLYLRAASNPAASADLESKLGFTEVRLGRTDAGLARMRRALERDPAHGGTDDRLVTALVWLDRLDEAGDMAEHRIEASAPAPESYLRAASIRAQRGDLDRAAVILTAGSARFPESQKLRAALAEVARQMPGLTKVL